MVGAPEKASRPCARCWNRSHVIVLTPAYDSMSIWLTTSAATSAAGPPGAARRLGNDLDELERLITTDTRLVIVNFPCNPTGYLPDAAEFDALLDIVRRHGAWLL